MNLTYSPELIQAATISTAFIFFGISEHIYIFPKVKLNCFHQDKGGFHLLSLIIKEIKSHMTC